MADKKLCKSTKHRMFSGVCGGFADFFNIDPTIVRLIFVILGCIKGIGIIGYIICIFVLPTDFSEIEKSESVEGSTETQSDKTAKNKAKTKKAPHTDEEFDSFFSKK